MNFGLPRTLEVNGREEPIRWEYTAVLDAISALNDAELKNEEKLYCFLTIIYENFEQFEKEDYEPAFRAAMDFVNNGVEEERRTNIKMVEVDFPRLLYGNRRMHLRNGVDDPK